MTLIGISGHANCGKNTVSDIMLSLMPQYESKAFAGKLKEIARILTGHGDQYTREGKAHYLPEWGMTAGRLQQLLGTEAIRNGIKDDAWVLALFSDWTPDSNWVITDVRFPNEVKSIKEHGGFTVRIIRDIQDDCGRDGLHESETALDSYDDWDFVVWNTGTMNDLIEQVEQVCNRIKQLT